MRGISMYKFSTQRLTRTAIGLAAVSAFALAPMAAQAATSGSSPVTGDLTSGGVSIVAPTFGGFDTTLTGLTQTAYTTVGGWSVTDATGAAPGYSINVTATLPTDVALDTLPAGSIKLTPTAAGANALNPSTLAPYTGAGTTINAGAQSALPTTGAAGVTIDNAPAGRGPGEWDFAADLGTPGTDATPLYDPTGNSLAVVIPGNTKAGTYTSSVTFTTAAHV
jgi:hypothetical protein